MSAALDAYTTWDQSTGPWWSRSVTDVVNDTYRTSFIYGRLFTGKDVEMELIQGGTSIQDIVLLDYQKTAVRINPGTKTPVQNIQSGTLIDIPWAFLRGQTMVDDQELMLNGGGGGGGYAQKYKSVQYQKNQVLETDTREIVDDECIGNVPNRAQQEDASPAEPRDPYSMHVFVNEFNVNTNAEVYGDSTGPALIGGLGGAGLIPEGIDAGGNGWTTVETVNPVTAGQTTWRPFQQTYGQYTAATAATAGTNRPLEALKLFEVLSESFRKTGIDQLPMGGGEWSDPRTIPNVIYCSNEGMTFVEQGLRTNQTYFFGMNQRGGQDPNYNAPVFNNIPFVYIAALDTILLYPTTETVATTVGVTELDATAFHGGPRFIGVNGRYIMPFVHSEKYWEQTGWMIPDGMPETRVKYTNLWNNTGCRSRRRQFHIRPDTAIVTA